ncbi:helix-turn-helix transcriptional regulator [Hydrogenophilus thermoluteolus]|nr:AlpA family transcriptional regulator [Hydrogenophilus thermoluteolus]
MMENTNRILRLPEVIAITKISRPTIYRWAREGLFPAPLKLGPRAIGWRADEIDAWLESRDRKQNA